MESDIGSWTSDHEGVLHSTAPILEILDGNGVQSTFFYTGDAALTSPKLLSQVRAAGHEIGCHTLHHEAMGDRLVEIPIPPVLPEEIPNRVKKATELVERLAGVRPVCFRAPRGWASAEMLVALDGLGYLVDSSYLTFFLQKHFLPYHPSATDWREPGDLNILEMPIFCDPGGKRDIIERAGDQWPIYRVDGGDAAAELVFRLAEMLWAQGKPAVAVMYFHPWEFIEMSPVVVTDEAKIEFNEFLWKGTGQPAREGLDTLLKRLRSAGAQLHTLHELRDLWVSELGRQEAGQ
jgi:peptidoglycan/xylan/chitin deacetylase (PgdA/CDA1 family)